MRKRYSETLAAQQRMFLAAHFYAAAVKRLLALLINFSGKSDWQSSHLRILF
jgi:hypothetical protein